MAISYCAEASPFAAAVRSVGPKADGSLSAGDAGAAGNAAGGAAGCVAAGDAAGATVFAAGAGFGEGGMEPVTSRSPAGGAAATGAGGAMGIVGRALGKAPAGREIS